MDAARLDLTSPAFAADPYATYDRLLAERPVHYCERTGVWYVARYRDVVELLRHPAASVERSDRLTAGLPDEERRSVHAITDVLGRMALFRDPPEQRWLHRAIARPIGPRRVGAMAPHIESIVERLLDDVAEAGRMDVIADLSYPLPTTLIAELLGADPADRALFRRWSYDITQILGTPTDAALARRAHHSLEEAVEYFRPMVRLARGSGDDNGDWRGAILRELLDAEDRHTEVDEEDVLAGCVLAVFAGHDTTTHLIANGLLTLLRHPDQLERLRAEPELIGTAVDECLRFESPIQRTGRLIGKTVVVRDTRIPAGSAVNLLLAAAHRDPEIFADPGRFDIARADNPHLAFGDGMHRCPGGWLGRLEARAAIGAIVRRFDALELTATPEWDYNVVFRRLKALPVAFRAGRPSRGGRLPSRSPETTASPACAGTRPSRSCGSPRGSTAPH